MKKVRTKIAEKQFLKKQDERLKKMTNSKKVTIISVVSGVSAIVSSIIAYAVAKRTLDGNKERVLYEVENSFDFDDDYKISEKAVKETALAN